ncbi:MAG: hypothetical protein ACKVTZ_19325 [Bacteroidia bacterium]
MDIAKLMEEIENKYADQEIEDVRGAVIEDLATLNQKVVEDAPALLDKYLVLAAKSMGGVYIPYVFWYKLGEFYEETVATRVFLQELIRIFANSDFEEEEQRQIKPLLIVYLAREKEFEIDKIRTLIIDKTHPKVKDYFYKLFAFVEKNQKSTQMYTDKFNLLKDYVPNFELLSQPVSKLKEMLT